MDEERGRDEAQKAKVYVAGLNKYVPSIFNYRLPKKILKVHSDNLEKS